MSDNQEAQSDELLALGSIYDEEEFRKTESMQKGEIHLCLELPHNFRLLIKGQVCVEYGISFLPPLVLSFELPTDYPSSSTPVFTLSCKWLSRVQMTALCKRLDELWEENRGNVVLFIWIQFLKEETLEFLNIKSPLKIQNISGQPQCKYGQNPAVDTAVEKSKVQELDKRAVQEVDPHTDILTQLLDFNEIQKQKVFDGKVFSCGICFSENLGSKSLLFKECQHVYCKACMKEYFQFQIRDGKVQCLTCPEPECMSMATPAQVKLLVSQDEFARYDRLLLQWSLNLMADVVYCPRVSCCMAVMIEPDTTMGICPSCQFVFCTLCKRTYHGLSLCKENELRMLKDAAEKEEKELLEKQRKENEKQLIQRAADELLSEDWLKENSKRCPSCGANIQKLVRMAVFQHDNNPKHTAKITTALLRKLKVKEWDSMSIDLNPLEHLLGIIKWKVEKQHVSNIQQLCDVIIKEWKKTFPAAACAAPVNAMPRMIKAVLDNDGNTKY